MKKKSYVISTHILFMYNHIFMLSDSFHLEKKISLWNRVIDLCYCERISNRKDRPEENIQKEVQKHRLEDNPETKISWTYKQNIWSIVKGSKIQKSKAKNGQKPYLKS